MNRGTKHVWQLILGLVAIALCVALLDAVSPSLPGSTGATVRHNMERGIDATALFYTESGEVSRLIGADHTRSRPDDTRSCPDDTRSCPDDERSHLDSDASP